MNTKEKILNGVIAAGLAGVMMGGLVTWGIKSAKRESESSSDFYLKNPIVYSEETEEDRDLTDRYYDQMLVVEGQLPNWQKGTNRVRVHQTDFKIIRSSYSSEDLRYPPGAGDRITLPYAKIHPGKFRNVVEYHMPKDFALKGSKAQ
mgnify:CR=1 FL=1